MTGLGSLEVKSAMALDYRESGLSKIQVAEKVGVTEAVLNDWLAPSKPHCRISAEKVDDWCRATGSHRLAEMIARACGLGFDIDLGRATRQRRAAERIIEEMTAA